jgi:hypothetical protein
MKYFTLLFVVVLVLNSVADAKASQTVEEKQATHIKAEVERRGTGEKSRVKVRLRNKAEVKGYVSKIQDSSFDVTDKISGQATRISYADVEKVQGPGLSRGAKIGIIVGVGVAIVVVVFAAEAKAHGY